MVPWLRCVAAVLLACVWHGGASAQPQLQTQAQPQVLVPGIEWLAGRFVAGAQPDGNSVLIEAPEGWIVVDTGRYPAHAQALLARVSASGKPLRVIVNSHWHLDHIGGNRALRDAHPSARVVGSDAIVQARTGFLADYRQQLQGELARRPTGDAQRAGFEREIAVIDDTAASTPDLLVGDLGSLALAGLTLRVGLQRNAVTAGDVWLFEPRSGVLVAGDLVTLPAPLLDTACPERWGFALEQFAAVPFRWLVPGHGAPLSRDQFIDYREGYYRLLRCAAADAPKQRCIEGWLRDAAALVPPPERPLARSLLSHYLDTRLRAPRTAACRW